MKKHENGTNKPNVSPREYALKVLHKIETESAYANIQMLDMPFDKLDRAFVSSLVYGTLKNRTLLDYMYMQFSSIKADRISVWVKNILRSAVYQMCFMEKIPHNAAVNEAVNLAKRYANKGAVGFVNGILRSVSRNRDSIKMPVELDILYSHPKWITHKFELQYGRETAEKILRFNNKPPKVFLRVNTLKIAPEQLADKLKEEGLICRIDEEIPYCLITEGIDVKRSEAFRMGLYTVQDRSSMLAVEALGPKPGELILDMCSAPGGKTGQIAEMTEAHIIACDIYEHKLKLIRDMAERLGLSSIETELRDSAVYNSEFAGKFDRVLLDAPCSGLGVLHKKADIRWKKSEEDVLRLADIQERMLYNVSAYLKPGGTLVYSTCTLTNEENRQQIRRFLGRDNSIKKVSEMVLFTHETGGSGFYIFCGRKQD